MVIELTEIENTFYNRWFAVDANPNDKELGEDIVAEIAADFGEEGARYVIGLLKKFDVIIKE